MAKYFTVHNECSEIPRSNSMLVVNPVSGSRVFSSEPSFTFLYAGINIRASNSCRVTNNIRASNSCRVTNNTRASNSCRVTNFLLYASLFIQPHPPPKKKTKEVRFRQISQSRRPFRIRHIFIRTSP